MKAAKLPAWETEYYFATALKRKWRFDYAWPEQRIAFEQEGATFGRAVHVVSGFMKVKGVTVPIINKIIRVGGRHNSGSGFDADCDKYGHAAALGWTVIRASTRMIRDGEAITLLEMAFRLRAQYGLTANR